MHSAKVATGEDAGFAGYATFPPVVNEAKIEGYLHEMSNIEHSRDIGRPFDLQGEHYVVFGDTFCKNKAGDFVGVANNTVAHVPLPAYPCLTNYLEYEENEMVKLFVPLTEDEKEFEKQPGGCRVCLWMFGGVVEMGMGLVASGTTRALTEIMPWNMLVSWATSVDLFVRPEGGD